MSVLRVGIPTNEKVYAVVDKLLQDAGFEILRSPKHFFTDRDFACQTGIQCVFARVSELARLVAIGRLDAAFVTKDWWEESKNGFFCWRHYGKSSAKIFAEFPMHCRCEVAFVSEKYWYAAGVHEGGIGGALAAFIAIMKRKPLIATRFPRLVERFLYKTKGLSTLFYKNFVGEWWTEAMAPEVGLVSGGEELYVLLGTADFAVVQIETGETLANHALHAIEQILMSHLVLVGNDHPDLPIFALNILSVVARNLR